MLKKSLSLLLVFVMSIMAFAGIASADASAAPSAPSVVNGATYYLNKTFNANPSGTETLVEGASYDWFSKAANHEFSAVYNALGMNAKTSATYQTEISTAGDYVVSVDFMAPNISFVNASGAGKNLSIQISNYTACSIWNDNYLYVNGRTTGTQIVAGDWYRLTTQITLPSGDVTVTLNNLTTGVLVNQTSATGKVPTISLINFNFPDVTTNMLYTQNWRLYREKDKALAPAAPADVIGATYYIKNDFTARPSGTDSFNSNLTWASGNTLTYDADRNALKHAAYLLGTFSSAISTPGKYKLTMDFMVNDVSELTDAYRLQLNDFSVMNIAAETGAISLGGISTGYSVSDETWYTLEAELSHPKNNIEINVIDYSSGETVCSETFNSSNFASGISTIRLATAKTAQDQLYTQSWRLYTSASPAAPSDVTGATYYIKNDFAARPSGTDSFNSNLTWASGGTLTYDSDYNALKHAAYLLGTFSSAISTPGKYKLTMDFMVNDVSELTDAYRLQLNDFFVMNIAAGTGAISLGGISTGYAAVNKTWYTLEAVLSHPENKAKINVINCSTGAVVCSSGEVSVNSTYFADGISTIRLATAKTAQDQLYTQSWRLYKLANNFTAVSDGTTITASYILESAGNAVIAIALYDSSTDAMDSIAFNKYENYTGEVTAEIAEKAGCYAKAFLWNGNTLAPLFPAIEVE